MIHYTPSLAVDPTATTTVEMAVGEIERGLTAVVATDEEAIEVMTRLGFDTDHMIRRVALAQGDVEAFHAVG